MIPFMPNTFFCRIYDFIVIPLIPLIQKARVAVVRQTKSTKNHQDIAKGILTSNHFSRKMDQIHILTTKYRIRDHNKMLNVSKRAIF